MWALRREGGNGVGAGGAETRNRQKGREAKFRSALWDDRGNRLEGDRSVSCFGCSPLAVPQGMHWIGTGKNPRAPKWPSNDAIATFHPDF